MNPTPVNNPQDELRNLYAEKGELISQLEIGQFRLQNINARLNQILGLNIPQAPVQK